MITITSRQATTTLLGSSAYFLAYGSLQMLQYYKQCIVDSVSSNAVCYNMLSTATLAHILCALLGFLAGSYFDMQQQNRDRPLDAGGAKEPELSVPEFLARLIDTRRFTSRGAIVVIALAIWHAFGPGDRRLRGYLERCTGTWLDDTAVCYIRSSGVVGGYVCTGLVAVPIARFWERRYGRSAPRG
jgi:hypothetical protein